MAQGGTSGHRLHRMAPIKKVLRRVSGAEVVKIVDVNHLAVRVAGLKVRLEIRHRWLAAVITVSLSGCDGGKVIHGLGGQNRRKTGKIGVVSEPFGLA